MSGGVARVINHDGTPLIGVRVVHKYYILVTIENQFGLMLENNVAALKQFNISQHFRLLKELVEGLKKCVGENNVVWISPTTNCRIEAAKDGRPESNKRNPTEDDFIKAHKGTNNEVIFNYGHGSDSLAALVFWTASRIPPRKENLTVEKVETEIGKETTEEAKKNFKMKRSQNYVCHQKTHKNRWRDVLPNAKFYFERRTNESEMAQVFLNGLANEINRICPGGHNKQYKFICMTSCGKSEKNRCDDVINCNVPRFRDGVETRIGELKAGKFICRTEGCINEDERCENISQCKDERYRNEEMPRQGEWSKIDR